MRAHLCLRGSFYSRNPASKGAAAVVVLDPTSWAKQIASTVVSMGVSYCSIHIMKPLSLIITPHPPPRNDDYSSTVLHGGEYLLRVLLLGVRGVSYWRKGILKPEPETLHPKP